MAENKQERKTFKWGDNEYLLDDLLKMHAEQENNYYDFARNRGKYDDEALAGLRTTITNRINAVKNGQTFSADGVLDTDQVDNISIQTQKKGLFKKDKYVAQDNTEWAKYYLNKLVSTLKPYQKEASKDTTGWDISKHGLNAYLTGQGINAQEIFENYDTDRDVNNTEAVRDFTQRHAKLREYLGGYKNWLENKKFDFTKNDNEWDDNFMSELSNLINNTDWNDRTALASSLRKLGAGEGYTTAFTSDSWDLTKSKKELEAEAKQRKAEENAKLKSGRMKEAQDEFLNNYKKENGSYLQFIDYSNHNFGEGVTPSFMKYYTDLSNEQKKPYGTYLGTDSGTWNAAYQDLMKSLREGTAYTDNNKGIILQRYFEDAPNGFTDVGDGLYLINESINDKGEGYVYDPSSRYLQKRHISEFANQNPNIKKVYENLLYDYINQKYGTNYDNRTYISFREGGILKAQLGAAVLRPYDANEQYKEKSSESGLDTKTQKARDRYISSKNKSESNPNAGFTEAETARLISIGADVISMFLDPITGTAVGLGSTLTNFGADIIDDGFQWEDVKNLGINIGFDLLGAIPIFGDTFGTGSKIVRRLAKFGPRMMAGLAAYQGYNNFDGMMNSWSKLLSSNENAKMTVQDFRNIAQSISLVTGAGRAIKNKAAQNTMKNKAKVDGVIGIDIYDKSAKKTRRILVDGDVAKQVRETEGNKAKVEAVLSKLEDFKDKFGESGTLEVLTGRKGNWQSPIYRNSRKDGSKFVDLRSIRGEGRAAVTDFYDFSRVPEGYGSFFGKQPKFTKGLATWHQDLAARGNKKLHPEINDYRGKIIHEAEQTRLLNEQGVEAQIGKVKEAVEARKKYLEKLQGRINDIESEITTAKQTAGGDDFVMQQAAAETLLAGLPSKKQIYDAQAIIKSRQKLIEQNPKRIRDLRKKEQEELFDIKTRRKAQHNSLNKELHNLETSKKAIETKLKAGNDDLGDLGEFYDLLRKIEDTKQAISDNKNYISANTNIIKSRYGNIRSKLKRGIKSAKAEKKAQEPIAAQRQNVLDAIVQRDAAISGQALQQRLNVLQGRKASHDPTTVHTHAFKELETMLNNLKTSNPTIENEAINWNMDAILQKYGVNPSDVFKQGGSINRNKINKFLNYAKG